MMLVSRFFSIQVLLLAGNWTTCSVAMLWPNYKQASQGELGFYTSEHTDFKSIFVFLLEGRPPTPYTSIAVVLSS